MGEAAAGVCMEVAQGVGLSPWASTSTRLIPGTGNLVDGCFLWQPEPWLLPHGFWEQSPVPYPWKGAQPGGRSQFLASVVGGGVMEEMDNGVLQWIQGALLGVRNPQRSQAWGTGGLSLSPGPSPLVMPTANLGMVPTWETSRLS